MRLAFARRRTARLQSLPILDHTHARSDAMPASHSQAAQRHSLIDRNLP